MEVRVLWDQRVPMRDGVTLSADLYRPAGVSEALPAIVLRTPYGKTADVTVQGAKYFAAQGYHVVCADVRGRGDSDGVFVPYRQEGEDGYDLIEWTAAQDWCDGKVGTMGASYLGMIQWLTALQQPPSLQAMIVSVTPSDPFREWPTGTMTPHHLCWLFMTSGRQRQNMDAVDWHKVYEHLPLYTMDEQTGRDIPFWREEMQHTTLDAWWREICYQDKFDQLDLPVLHISGWYDDEHIGTPLNFTGMSTQAKSAHARRNQKLIMGPWGHAVNTTSKLGEIEFGPQALIDLRGAQVRFFDRWLKGIANGVDQEPNAQIFVMGKNEWRAEQEFPLARTQWTPYYLHSGGQANSRFGDGRLSTARPTAEQGTAEAADHYTYDPSNPVPFLTEGTSSQIGGPENYATVEERPDVLVYSSDVLTEELEVTGPIKMELYATSSAPDTDFAVKLLDVHPDGYVQRLTDGLVRARFREGMDRPQLIEPGQVYRYEVDCWYTSHVFLPGHQVRIEIASSAFPKYDRNLNTGAPLGMTTEMAVAEQTVHHDRVHASAVRLPVIPQE